MTGPRTALSGMEILLVEDDARALEVTAHMLSKRLGKVTVARNGQEALQHLEAGQIFHAIVTDIRMPVMNGLELCRHVKSSSDTPVVIITAHSDSEYFLEALEVGVDHFLLKPLDMDRLLAILQQIAEKQSLKWEAAENLKLLEDYRTLLDEGFIVSRADKSGIITYVNDRFCNVSGFDRDELIGKNHNIIRHPDMPSEFFRHFWETIQSGKIWKGRIKNRKKNGDFYYVDTIVAPIMDAAGEILEYVSLRYDITELILTKEALEKEKQNLEILATTDHLTGLHNRFYFEKLTRMEMERSERYKHPLSLILYDIDHFKQVNDVHGHQAGDAILIRLSLLVRESLRKYDIPGRWGGEEFVILCPETDEERTRHLAERIREVIQNHSFDGVGKITCSFGITALHPDDSFDSLFLRADKFLYEAKKSGRNRVC